MFVEFDPHVHCPDCRGWGEKRILAHVIRDIGSKNSTHVQVPVRSTYDSCGTCGGTGAAYRPISRAGVDQTGHDLR